METQIRVVTVVNFKKFYNKIFDDNRDGLKKYLIYSRELIWVRLLLEREFSCWNRNNSVIISGMYVYKNEIVA